MYFQKMLNVMNSKKCDKVLLSISHTCTMFCCHKVVMWILLQWPLGIFLLHVSWFYNYILLSAGPQVTIYIHTCRCCLCRYMYVTTIQTSIRYIIQHGVQGVRERARVFQTFWDSLMEWQWCIQVGLQCYRIFCPPKICLKLLIWFIYLLAIKIRKLFRPLIISLATIIYFYDMSW